MPSISIGGLGNGIDFGQIVSQLVSIAQIPITTLQNQQKGLRDTLTGYTTLGTKLLALQSAANTLRAGRRFDATTAGSSDETRVIATAASTALPGSYTIQVSQLASTHQIANKAAKAVSGTGDSIVTGSSATFSFTVGNGAAQTVALGENATIEDLQAAINDLEAGVTASILNTGSDSSPAYRLVLTSNQSGESNAITVTADTTDLDFLNASGTGGIDTLQAAQDAVLMLGDPAQNPVTVQRSGNTITDAIPGVTLNLKAASTTDLVTLNVSRDTSAVAGNIKALVGKYNEIVTFINERTKYDPETRKGGDFVGEGAVRTVLNRIRQSLSSSIDGLSTFTGVSQVGFQTQRDGTITLDEGRLSAALSANYTAVRDLFIGQPTSTGAAQRLFDAIDALKDIQHGTLTVRQKGLNDQIASLTGTITQKQQQLSAYQERLQLQFASLDALVRQIQTQSGFLNKLG
jgi:flagellar hook-associated protein 2